MLKRTIPHVVPGAVETKLEGALSSGQAAQSVQEPVKKKLKKAPSSETGHRGAHIQRFLKLAQAYRPYFFTPSDTQWREIHKELSETFFPILCNWLIELHFELFGDHMRRFQCDSPLIPIQRAMKYLFLYLSCSKEAVGSSHLQLVGASCYQISIELALGRSETEKLKLDAKRYAYYTDNAYKPKQVKNMTKNVRTVIEARHQEFNNLLGNMRSLHAVDKHSEAFRVHTPTEALQDIIEMMRSESGEPIPLLTRLFASYAIDIAMHDTAFSTVVPSRIAAAALVFACKKTKPLLNVAMILNRVSGLDAFLALDEKRIERIFRVAQLHEADRPGLDTQVLPRYSMVVTHYQSKFIQWVQGQLRPRFKRNVFGPRGHKTVLSAHSDSSSAAHGARRHLNMQETK